MKLILRLSLLLAFLSCSIPLFAQEQKVRGTVTDTDNQPVAGAVVYYEGTNTSSVTDSDGKYEIYAKKGKSLVFSYFGMKDVRIMMNGQTICDVIMEPDEMVLEDAVVIGYGSVSRRDLTGSVTSVKADELKKAGNSNASQTDRDRRNECIRQERAGHRAGRALWRRGRLGGFQAGVPRL